MKPISKINVRSLGDPVAFLTTAAAGDKRWPWGAIYGQAVGLSKRTNADGERVQEGLQGIFETSPVVKDAKVVQSAVLYLPEGLAGDFLKVFRPVKDYVPPKALHLCVDVFLLRAENTQGYTWEIVPILVSADTADPLTTVRNEVQKARAEKKPVDKKK